MGFPDTPVGGWNGGTVEDGLQFELHRTSVSCLWGRGMAHAEENNKNTNVIQQSAKAISCQLLNRIPLKAPQTPEPGETSGAGLPSRTIPRPKE